MTTLSEAAATIAGSASPPSGYGCHLPAPSRSTLRVQYLAAEAFPCFARLEVHL